MSVLLGSSEILEAARLFSDLIKHDAPHEETADRFTFEPPEAEVAAAYTAPAATVDTPAAVAAPPTAAPKPARPAPPRPEFSDELRNMAFRGDKLEHILAAMCIRAGFIGAVVADEGGLPLAVFNSPINEDVLSAFTSVLGGALEKAATILGKSGADGISMDLDYADKLAMRRFFISNRPYFIMVICPQDIDERSEIEITTEQLTAVLTGE